MTKLCIVLSGFTYRKINFKKNTMTKQLMIIEWIAHSKK